MKLTDNKEPILLIGPKCYKSYAAKIILNNPTEVYLNRESTVSQLLGSHYFFSKAEHNLFIIKKIYEILIKNNYNENEVKNWNKEKIETFKDGIKKEIEERSDFKKKLIKNLIENLETKENEHAIINLKMVFKPGLILNAILNDKPLILKNISKVKTSVLERFNELFSEKNILTLYEDITNTFTKEEDRELTNFKDFKIIATSRLSDQITLSEAILSRFTLINVEDYKNEERQIIINKKTNDEHLLGIIKKYDLSSDEILFGITISDKLKDDNNKLKPLIFYIIKNGKREKGSSDNLLNEPKWVVNEFPFKIHKNNSTIISKRSQLEYPYKVKYSENNSNEFHQEDEEVSKKFFENINRNIFFTKKFSEICDLIHFSFCSKTPLILEGEVGQGKKTAIHLMAQSFGLKIVHTILSKSMKYDELLMQMIISKDENEEPKLKYEKTNVYKALENNASDEIIIIDEINNASPDVLDLLTNIMVDNKALLPDGNQLEVKNLKIIGIINRNNNENLLDKIPLKLKSNCLYHIVENPDENDIRNIIANLFNYVYYDEKSKTLDQESIINYVKNKSDDKILEKESDDKILSSYKHFIKKERNNFIEKFLKSLAFVNSKLIEPKFNLIDAKKYIDFRKKNPKIDDIYLMLFIFVYRFDCQEIQKEIMNELNLSLTDFEPYIKYDFDENKNQPKLYIFLGKNKLSVIDFEMKNSQMDELKEEDNIHLFSSLTKIQKLGFIFLACCVESGRVPLIQGETASGKSYLMKIFAKIFGQKTNLYQINSNSGMSIITGQDIIMTNIDKDKEEKDLKCNYNDIKKLIKMEKKNFEQLEVNDYKLILKKILDKLENNKDLKEDDKNKLIIAKNIFINSISLRKRIAHKKSRFILAAEKEREKEGEKEREKEKKVEGKWIIFDGIEMGQTILFDNISSLCTENPYLNILDSASSDSSKAGSNIILDKDTLSPDFKLFLIFNPFNLGKKSINQILFNSCARFSLTPLDIDYINSYHVIYNFLYEKSLNFNEILWGKICSKLALCHKINTKESKNHIDTIAGGTKFSPRHLVFLGRDGKKNEITKKNDEISAWIKAIFQLYYFNSFIPIDIEKVKNKVINEFTKEDIFEKNEENENNIIDIDVTNVLDELCKIQKSNSENKYYFSFKNFVKKCLKLRLNKENIQLIINNIEDTLNLLLYNNKDNDNKGYDEALSNFFQISIIKNLLLELKDKISKIELKDIEHFQLESEQLLNNEKLKEIILRIKLLISLLDNDEVFCDKLNYKIYDSRFQKLSKYFENFINEQNIKGFSKLIKQCSKHPSVFEMMDFFFPKHKFFQHEDYNLIILYIKAISEMVRNKINFSIEINGTKYKFVTNPNNNIQYGTINNLELCLNNKDHFYITKKTKIEIPLIDDNNNELEIGKELDNTQSENLLQFVVEYAKKKNITKSIKEVYCNFKFKEKKNEIDFQNFSSIYFVNPKKNSNIY